MFKLVNALPGFGADGERVLVCGARVCFVGDEEDGLRKLFFDVIEEVLLFGNGVPAEFGGVDDENDEAGEVFEGENAVLFDGVSFVYGPVEEAGRVNVLVAVRVVAEVECFGSEGVCGGFWRAAGEHGEKGAFADVWRAGNDNG